MRALLAPILCLLLLPTLAGCGSGDDRPNVVLVVWDTVRADRCSAFGYDRPTTPALERVAAEGVSFDRAWSPAGWTAPAHASMFTGLRPERHGLLLGNRPFLDSSQQTLAGRLETAGYRTACFTNNVWIDSQTGLDGGFAEYDSIRSRPDEEYPTCRWAFEAGLQFARKSHESGEPFFLFLNLMEAHLPFTPPPEQQARFVPKDASPEEVAAARRYDTPDAVRHITGLERTSPRTLEVLSDLYDAEVATLDSAFADFFDGLAAAGGLEDTLLVVVSDHGENLGDHDLISHKVSLHRSIREVPLVIRMPGVFDGGRRVEDLVRLEDLFPTILEVCDVPIPEGIDGESLLADTSGRISRGAWGASGGNLEVPEVKDAPPEADLSRFAAAYRAVFDGRHHLIEATDGRTELYDLAEDPTETRNLAPDRPDLLPRLRPLLPR